MIFKDGKVNIPALVILIFISLLFAEAQNYCSPVSFLSSEPYHMIKKIETSPFCYIKIFNPEPPELQWPYQMDNIYNSDVVPASGTTTSIVSSGSLIRLA